MISINMPMKSFKSFFAELQSEVKVWVSRQIEVRLEAEVDGRLYRRSYERRVGVGSQQTNQQCQRCGTKQVRHFSRNGHRERQIVTRYGVLTIWLPRVVCDCGGSVALPFTILAPYQRLWEDVLEHIGRWAALGLSLRQRQDELGDQLHTQIGLRKLNEVVQDVSQPVEMVLSSVPPVVMLDAIWLTVFEDGATRQTDRLGRQRVSTHANKGCVLLALGLYPQTGRWGVLSWTLAESESQDAWERLLTPLELRGLYRERGVELFIHDGGAGLTAALKLMYPHVPHQRCLFHKLRNIWHAICPPTDLSGIDLRTFKRDLLHHARSIFFASSTDEALRLRDDFSRLWRDSQPELVATVCRDWHESIAFLRVHLRFPAWPLTALRTTSLLERLNRRFIRAAAAFHSGAGLSAILARILNPIRFI